MPRAHYHPPRKPFRCACGETRPYAFGCRYKSICEACRRVRERDRQREKAAARRAA